MSVFRPCVWTVTTWSGQASVSFTSIGVFGLKVLQRKAANFCCCKLLCVGSVSWFHFWCFFLSFIFIFCLPFIACFHSFADQANHLFWLNVFFFLYGSSSCGCDGGGISILNWSFFPP